MAQLAALGVPLSAAQRMLESSGAGLLGLGLPNPVAGTFMCHHAGVVVVQLGRSGVLLFLSPLFGVVSGCWISMISPTTHVSYQTAFVLRGRVHR